MIEIFSEAYRCSCALAAWSSSLSRDRDRMSRFSRGNLQQTRETEHQAGLALVTSLMRTAIIRLGRTDATEFC